MTTVPAQLQDPALVETLVAAVMQRLTTGAVGDGGAASSGQGAAVAVPGRVVTGDSLLAVITEDTRQVLLHPGAILTPTAREVLAQHGCVVGEHRDEPHTGTSEETWPVVVADASVPGTWAEPAVRTCDDAETAIAWCGERLRGLPGSGVVLLAGHPHRLACLANRNPVLRAAVAQTGEEAGQVLAGMGANLIVLNPHVAGPWQLRQVIEACRRHGPAVMPGDWTSEGVRGVSNRGLRMTS